MTNNELVSFLSFSVPLNQMCARAQITPQATVMDLTAIVQSTDAEISHLEKVRTLQQYHQMCARTIIWRNVSELFGVMLALHRNASRTVAARNMAAIHKAESHIYPYRRSDSRFSRRDACPSTSGVQTQWYAK
jgi:hypothetical protein